MASEPRLSAVVACYKDAPAIQPMHARLTQVFASLGVDYEIIFVNDGSPDDTDAILEAVIASDDRVVAIQHSRNFGSQNSFVSGMELATGDAVVLLDGDLQDPPELIAAFFEKWRQGNDVVYGRRVKREDSDWLAPCRWLFYRLFRRVSEVPMPLDAGDFALMDRRVVDELLALPEADQFLRGLRAWVGFRQTGVDYVRPKRPFGRSNHDLRKNVWWAKKGIFSFTSVPIELLGYAGAGLTVLAVCGLVHHGVQALRYPGVAPGIPLIVLVVAFFGSLNLLAIAVIGEYLLKVVEETKRRPKFIRRAVRYRKQHLTTAGAIDRFVRERARGEGSAPRARAHEEA